MLVRSNHLVGLPSNFQVRVTVKDFKALNHLVFNVRWRTITHVMQDLEPNVLVIVVCQLEYSLPELRNISLDVAWAHLSDRSHLDLDVVALRVLNQGFDVFRVFNNV